MDPNNYIRDENPFKLAGPPKWWLQKLWDFDNSLVVVPSRMGFYYRLAQRRPLDPKVALVNEMLKTESDTRMLASHSLIPVTTITATANWDNPLMWVDLEQRAPWRMGGADKVIKLIEDAEFEKHLKARRKEEQDVVDRAKFGWQYYQSKTGSKTFVNKEKVLYA